MVGLLNKGIENEKYFSAGTGWYPTLKADYVQPQHVGVAQRLAQFQTVGGIHKIGLPNPGRAKHAIIMAP
jgi:hypothetical protein